ncbi:MAG: right-handed parallel beta-helix repeat-containing protein [Planctomycetaceae bacterium]
MLFLSRGFLVPAFAAILLGMPSGASRAVELEVDNRQGSDLQSAATGLATRSPYRTIQRAIEHASLGDVIRVRNTGEPYHESISIHSNHRLGAPGFPLVIEGGGATLDGTQPLGVLDWAAMGRDLFELQLRSPGYATILAADDQPLPEYLGHVKDLSSLEPLQYARSNGSIFFRVRRGDVPQIYGLRLGVQQTGLTLYDVSHIVIRDLNVVGYRLDGINCHGLVTDVRFENVVAEKNGRSGISVGGASQVLMERSRLQNNGESQARVEGHSLLELNQVQIEAGKAKAIEQDGGRVTERR